MGVNQGGSAGQVVAARSSTEERVNDPSIPCHHRRSQWEQLCIVIGSPLTRISITTRWRVRQVGHLIELLCRQQVPGA